MRGISPGIVGAYDSFRRRAPAVVYIRSGDWHRFPTQRPFACQATHGDERRSGTARIPLSERSRDSETGPAPGLAALFVPTNVPTVPRVGQSSGMADRESSSGVRGMGTVGFEPTTSRV